MNNFIVFRYVVVAFVALCASLSAPPARAEPGYWTQRDARVLPGGRAELMLTGPSRISIKERLEVGVGLFVLAALPNAQLKWALFEQVEEDADEGERPWSVALCHRLLLPGFLYQLTMDGGASSQGLGWFDVLALDTDLMMTRVVPDGVWSVRVGGVATLRGASSEGAQALEGAPLLLWHRAPLVAGEPLGWGVRGAVSRRQYMGRGGWFVRGEGALYLSPQVRRVGLELEARVGLERRHLFVEFGGRTASDGVRFETLPVLELGVALE